MSSLKELDKEYIAGTYKRFPVEIAWGKGSLLYDGNGKEYIDMGSGIGVTSFGAGDEMWKSAVIAQLDKVSHTSNLYYTSPCVELAKLMCEKTGMKKVFFSNSGAEANECAIKVARKYAAEKKGKDYYTIVTLTNSFHGRTLTTLAATGQEHYHELYNPLTPGFVSLDITEPDIFTSLAKLHKPAAIMIECIQGEGGVIALEKDFTESIYEFCKREDILLIVDEVQTGNGRTGELYAYMNYNISPDIVSTAKGLGGGLPLGATMLSERVQDVLSYGDHGSTFGANPVCCAGAISVLSRIDGAFLSEVKEKSKYVFSSLRGAKGIKSVSGMGLMIGIETEKSAVQVINECIEKGVLCLSAKNKVRLLPALNIPMDILEKAIDIIKEVCAQEE